MMQVRTFQDDWSESESESYREVVVENSAGDRVVVQEIAGRLMLAEDASRYAHREPDRYHGQL